MRNNNEQEQTGSTDSDAALEKHYASILKNNPNNPLDTHVPVPQAAIRRRKAAVMAKVWDDTNLRANRARNTENILSEINQASANNQTPHRPPTLPLQTSPQQRKP